MEIHNDQAARSSLWQSIRPKYWAWAVILGLLGAVGGYAASGNVPQNHQATAIILVSPLEGNPFYPSSRGEQLVNLFTESKMLTSDTVAEMVIEETGAEGSAADLLRGLSTNVPANTQLIEITYEHRDPQIAVQRAQSFADSYLQFRSDRATGYVDGQINGLRAETEKLTDRMSELNARLNDADTSAVDKSILEAQLTAAATQISSLGARESTLATTRIDPGEIITPGALDRSALIGPREIAALLGFLAGVGVVALVLMYRMRSHGMIRKDKDLQSLGIRTLQVNASAPQPAASQSGHPVPVLTDFQAQLLRLLQTGNRRILLIAPASTRGTHPQSATVVARALANAEVETLFIDTTGQGNAMPGLRSTSTGFGQVLAGTNSLASVQQRVSAHLSLVGAGNLVNEFARGVDRQRIDSVLFEADTTTEAVIMVARDLEHPMTQWLVSSIPTVLIEVQLGETRLDEVDRARKICRDLSAEVKAVLIKAPQHGPRGQLRSFLRRWHRRGSVAPSSGGRTSASTGTGSGTEAKQQPDTDTSEGSRGQVSPGKVG